MINLTDILTSRSHLDMLLKMPAKNTIRFYKENGFYHVYNRGVEKRTIFQEIDDYKIFLYYLFIYLALPSLIEKKYPKLKNALRKGNFHSKLTLHCYILMPNHFHFLIHQTEKEFITQFMRRITNAYTAYFNKKYNRVGPLFQGVFKAIHIEKDEYLLHLSRYIHLNPSSFYTNELKEYFWSSYRTYLRSQNSSYVNTDFILQNFSQTNPSLSYKSFVESKEDLKIPAEYLLEDE